MHRVKDIQSVQKVCTEKSPSQLLLFIPLHRSNTAKNFVCTLMACFRYVKPRWIDVSMRAHSHAAFRQIEPDHKHHTAPRLF